MEGEKKSKLIVGKCCHIVWWSKSGSLWVCLQSTNADLVFDSHVSTKMWCLALSSGRLCRSA